MFFNVTKYLCWERERKRGGEKERKMSLSPLALSRKNSPFIKNCETRLNRGRKSIRVTQNILHSSSMILMMNMFFFVSRSWTSQPLILVRNACWMSWQEFHLCVGCQLDNWMLCQTMLWRYWKQFINYVTLKNCPFGWGLVKETAGDSLSYLVVTLVCRSYQLINSRCIVIK